MEIENYMEWVKDVNLEASKVDKCLSCFSLNSNTLKEYYEDGVTPMFAVIKLTLDNRQKEKCVCSEKRLKT